MIALTPARRRIALVLAFLTAWIAGSVLGAQERERAGAGPLLQIEPAHADYVPALNSEEPVFILVLGSDARPGEDVHGQRADSIHILAVNPAKQRATIVGIPRDSFVPVPGHGNNKINASMTLGGPELVVETVEALTGLTMDYWALSWFDGFKTMVDQIDGLVVDVPFSMSGDASSALFEPGLQLLDGRDALAFARERKSLPAGDLGRSENHGRLMIAALTQFQEEFQKDAGRMLTWIGAFVRNSNSSVPFDQLMNLAFTGTTINHKKVVNIVLPGGSGMVDELSVVIISQAELQAISADLADDGLLKKINIPPSPNEPLLGQE